MTRRTKLFLMMAVLGCLGGIGVVLSKIAREAGVPFPGAVVVLDDASWRAREDQDWSNSGYIWGSADTILYRQKVANGYQVVRRKVMPDKTVSLPETLPIVIGKSEHIVSLSPDGTTLCVLKVSQNSRDSYQLARADGKGKNVRFRSNAYLLYKSPDSQSLYGIDDSTSPLRIERIDAKTGAVTKTILDTKENFALDTITPEGKLLGVRADFISQAGQEVTQWKVNEVRGKKVVTTTHQKRFLPSVSLPILSPDGKRMLWWLIEKENSLQEKIQQKLFRKNIAPHEIIRCLITDIEGKNERRIGEFPLEMQNGLKLLPIWTPDSKGVSFVYNGKMMYLAVP